MRQRALGLGQQRVGEIVEGAPTALAPVAVQPWPIMVGTPEADVVTLAPGTLQRTIFPPEGMNVCLTLVNAEELVDVSHVQGV